MRRLFVTLVLGLAVLLQGAGLAFANSTPTKVLPNIAELMVSRGLSGAVRIQGHEKAGDGAAMTYRIVAAQPGGFEAHIALRLADGQWAVPTDLPTAPTTTADPAAVADAITRARTLVAAGSDLIWDAHRANFSPLSGKVTHQITQKPYPITCSLVVGMATMGWDYQHSTYVDTKNTRVGSYVEFGNASRSIWQAFRLARWFYGNGDLWYDGGTGQYQAGDILFLSKQDPEGPKTNGSFFGNVYHTAIYIGNGRIIHSYGPASKGGVVETPISAGDKKNIVFVARPRWINYQTPESTTPAPSATPKPSPTATAKPTPPTVQPTQTAKPMPSPTPTATAKPTRVPSLKPVPRVSQPVTAGGRLQRFFKPVVPKPAPRGIYPV